MLIPSSKDAYILQQYLNCLQAIKNSILVDKQLLPNVCQSVELSLVNQHYDTMLRNIEEQSRLCERLFY